MRTAIWIGAFVLSLALPIGALVVGLRQRRRTRARVSPSWLHTHAYEHDRS